jgi:uncharacterized protein YwlG (UPF0340 family)
MHIKRKNLMKNLIVLLVMLIPFVVIAQNKVDVSNSKTDRQTQEWMKKISSNSEMRSSMMGMMINETRGNKEEMTKLVSALLNDQDVRKIMLAMQPVEPVNRNISVEPKGMSNDSLKVMKMDYTLPVLKK